jgi:hypothetical protein
MQAGECQEYIRNVSKEISAAREAACHVARIREQMGDFSDQKFPPTCKIGDI